MHCNNSLRSTLRSRLREICVFRYNIRYNKLYFDITIIHIERDDLKTFDGAEQLRVKYLPTFPTQ